MHLLSNGEAQATREQFFRNDGGGRFAAASLPAPGVAGPALAAAWSDLDNDGDADLVVAGRGIQVRWNQRGALGPAEFLDEIRGERVSSWAIGDANSDGFFDLYVATSRGGLMFVNNGNRNNWLRVRLRGFDGAAEPYGAVVAVDLDDGRRLTHSKAWPRFERFGHEAIAHFGMGMASTARVAVFWPSGARQDLGEVAANQTVVALEPAPPPEASPRLLRPEWTADGFRFDVVGSFAGAYVVERSADLRHWDVVTSFQMAGGARGVLDADRNFSERAFYRVSFLGLSAARKAAIGHDQGD